MQQQRPRSWAVRIILGVSLGALVAAVSTIGYELRGRPAGASFQPQPTSIAFVPLYPTPEPVLTSAYAQFLPAEHAMRLGRAAFGAQERSALEQERDAFAGFGRGAVSEPTDLVGDECSFPCVAPGVGVDDDPGNAPDPDGVEEEGAVPDDAPDADASKAPEERSADPDGTEKDSTEKDSAEDSAEKDSAEDERADRETVDRETDDQDAPDRDADDQEAAGADEAPEAPEVADPVADPEEPSADPLAEEPETAPEAQDSSDSDTADEAPPEAADADETGSATESGIETGE